MLQNRAYLNEFFSVQVDSLSDETKMETQRDINTRALDEMATVNGGIQVFKSDISLLDTLKKRGFPKNLTVNRVGYKVI